MAVCIERKRYLSGAEVTFGCELVALEGRFGILKHVIDRQWQVQNVTLGPGTVTFAFYWAQRPYNLYWWVDENGETVGYYFNLADSVSLSAQEFVWRDLVVDILILPTGQVQVIDEHEVPDALDSELRRFIEAGKRQVQRDYQAIVEEASALLNRYTRI